VNAEGKLKIMISIYRPLPKETLQQACFPLAHKIIIPLEFQMG
jgi:hypothetical protein